MMSLSTHGMTTLQVEITNISSYGIWILSNDNELFLSYDEFPWFKDQPLKYILNIEEPIKGHFYWPDIDVDLSIDSINHADRFPLKAKVS